MPYNSYDINFYKLAHWVTPRWLRKSSFLILIRSCLYPLVLIHNAFKQYRDAKLYELSINAQVCYLEAFLNDRFDYTQRRIYIDDVATVPGLHIYTRAEATPILFYRRSEANPVPVFTRAEVMSNYTYDFIVYVPIGVVFQEPEMRAMIAGNLSGFYYKIELF